MKRKNLRILIRVLGCILAIFGFVGFVSVFWLVIASFVKGFAAQQDYWHIAYYSFAILGSVGTVLAVIVALEKETFNQILYSPEFEVSSPTLSPRIERSASDSSFVKSYSQYLRIENIGAADAKGCKLELIHLSFDKNKHRHFKDISP